MRIGIDAREIERNMTGIGRYLLGFMKYALNTPDEYFLYYSRRSDSELKYPNVRSRVLSGPQFLWDHIILPKAIDEDRIDLFFSPYYKKPWFLRCKSVITVHDLNPLFNEGFSCLRRIYFKALIKRSLSSADFVLVVSGYVKEQLLKIFNIDENKIIVNYNAVDGRFSPMQNDSSLGAILEKYGIKSSYILYVGNLMPHKNVLLLIKAYSGLPPEIKDRYKLVIGSKKEWTYNKLLALTDKLGLLGNVIFTGFIADDDLVSVYNGASLFVFPSLREGFGFPPLEAMACGVPVIASAVTSLPEVTGDAAILINPYDTQGLTKAIREILTREGLKTSLIQKGLIRAKEFSVEKMASRILGIFQKCRE